MEEVSPADVGAMAAPFGATLGMVAKNAPKLVAPAIVPRLPGVLSVVTDAPPTPGAPIVTATVAGNKSASNS
jgi:hypothetical protein